MSSGCDAVPVRSSSWRRWLSSERAVRDLTVALTGLIVLIPSIGAELVVRDTGPLLGRLVWRALLTVAFAGVLTALLTILAKWLGRRED